MNSPILAIVKRSLATIFDHWSWCFPIDLTSGAAPARLLRVSMNSESSSSSSEVDGAKMGEPREVYERLVALEKYRFVHKWWYLLLTNHPIIDTINRELTVLGVQAGTPFLDKPR